MGPVVAVFLFILLVYVAIFESRLKHTHTPRSRPHINTGDSPDGGLSHFVRLRDERLLCYQVRYYLVGGRAPPHGSQGASEVPTVLYEHGLAGCRYEGGGRGAELIPEAEVARTRAAKRGTIVRVVSVDRAGYGQSCSHMVGRSYETHARDVEELMAHLGISRYAVMGYSSGGCYAMACGHYLGAQSVPVVGLVSADGPWCEAPPSCFNTLHTLALFAVNYFRPLLRVMPHGLYLAVYVATGGFSSKKKVSRKIAIFKEALMGGWGAITQEMVTERLYWGFELERMAGASGPIVTLWHGDRDGMVPYPVGVWLRDRLGIPSAHFHAVEGEGHGLVSKRWGDLLMDMTTLLSA